MDSSLGSLQSRVNALTEENRELQDALTALSEAHETRTEASGTESEIVHRKTPSLHSDLSDAESDSDPHHSNLSTSPTSRNNTKSIINTSTSFQESGIFDSTNDFVNAATQTNKVIYLLIFQHIDALTAMCTIYGSLKLVIYVEDSIYGYKLIFSELLLKI